MAASVQWDDKVDQVIAGDAAAGFTYLTPARGVVIMPMAPLGLRDREQGTVTVTTSLGLPKKLVRLRANPSVALVYHAREHGDSTLPLFVVVQGIATVGQPDRAWLESIGPQWEHFLGKRYGGLRGRLLDVYYWQRVAITIDVRRVVCWDGTSVEPSVVFGEPLPDDPAPQAPPKLGTAPRVDTAKVAGHVERLPHSLLGWVGADGLPMVVDVTSEGADADGVRLVPVRGSLPAGGRRAGLTSHRFHEHMVGQEQRVHTGWLSVDGDRATYMPHTKAGHALPRSKALMVVGAGLGMRMGYRKARELGVAP